ncbi:MAG TPA: helix-turn-helix domain-containing protein, partial [Hyphomicrobiales bacterium]|nr:helix-turn-helix domain-containing protein [Hyphomicrobiales bacterium]
GLYAGLRARARKEAAALRAETMVETLRLFAVFVDTGAFYRDLSGAGVTDPLAEDEVMTRRRAIPTRLDAPDLAAATRAARRAVHDRALSVPALPNPAPVVAPLPAAKMAAATEAEAIEEAMLGLGPGASIADVIAAVAETYGVTREVAILGNKGGRVRPIRAHAAWLARMVTGEPWPAIAASIGYASVGAVEAASSDFAGASGVPTPAEYRRSLRPLDPSVVGAAGAETYGLAPGAEIGDIIAAVAAAHGVDVEGFAGRRRCAATSLLRQRVMWLCAALTRAPFSRIGAALGGRDCATVLHGIAAHCARHDLPHPRRGGRR